MALGAAMKLEGSTRSDVESLVEDEIASISEDDIDVLIGDEMADEDKTEDATETPAEEEKSNEESTNEGANTLVEGEMIEDDEADANDNGICEAVATTPGLFGIVPAMICMIFDAVVLETAGARDTWKLSRSYTT
jgi:hypothetical protein